VLQLAVSFILPYASFDYVLTRDVSHLLGRVHSIFDAAFNSVGVSLHQEWISIFVFSLSVNKVSTLSCYLLIVFELGVLSSFRYELGFQRVLLIENLIIITEHWSFLVIALLSFFLMELVCCVESYDRS
jgi:hypothetical protein